MTTLVDLPDAPSHADPQISLLTYTTQEWGEDMREDVLPDRVAR